MCFSKYAFVVKWCSEILFITKFFSHRISEITGTWKKKWGKSLAGKEKASTFALAFGREASPSDGEGDKRREIFEEIDRDSKKKQGKR